MGNRNISTFRTTVLEYYHKNGRHGLPWRVAEADGEFDPYKILVSEIMLQQTQVNRVIPKYSEFLDKFPRIKSLANAQLGDVLKVWNGLGYNRRAKYLWLAALMIESDFSGKIPNTTKELETLPGVGANTAGAITVYAFNRPAIFIETNVRTVFIHHFFRDKKDIPDIEIKSLAEATLDNGTPRVWYWALMDYGAYLKRNVGNLSRVSKSYTQQSKFEGSRRQVRGQVIRVLLEKPASKSNLKHLMQDPRLDSVLDELIEEKMVHLTDVGYTLFS